MPTSSEPQGRLEFITRGDRAPLNMAEGVEIRVLVTGSLGSERMSTVTATIQPGAELPWHTHTFSEVVTLTEGHATVQVEKRRYHLRDHDALHIPKGVAHLIGNQRGSEPAVLHFAFASDTLSRDWVAGDYAVEDYESPPESSPEHMMRFADAPSYELASRAMFRDLFAARFGAKGICGGYGVFAPGASLPCHFHGYDESITIVGGRATCQVAGREYELSNCDTACIPRGRPHRFLNRSDAPMAMIWVYAGDEPDRTVVEERICAGVRNE
jgi:quercetin dioxygenase-like cupin family protein